MIGPPGDSEPSHCSIRVTSRLGDGNERKVPCKSRAFGEKHLIDHHLTLVRCSPCCSHRVVRKIPSVAHGARNLAQSLAHDPGERRWLFFCPPGPGGSRWFPIPLSSPS